MRRSTLQHVGMVDKWQRRDLQGLSDKVRMHFIAEHTMPADQE